MMLALEPFLCYNYIGDNMKPGIYFVKRSDSSLPSLNGIFLEEHRHGRRLDRDFEEWLDFNYSQPSSEPVGEILAGPFTPEGLLAVIKRVEDAYKESP